MYSNGTNVYNISFCYRGQMATLSQHWGLVSVHRLFCYTKVEATRGSATIATLCACYAVENRTFYLVGTCTNRTSTGCLGTFPGVLEVWKANRSVLGM